MTTIPHKTVNFIKSGEVHHSVKFRRRNNRLNSLGEALAKSRRQLCIRLSLILTALSISLMNVSNSADAGNLVDTFTFQGTQPGFTSGTVYGLTVNGNTLNVCEFTPSGSSPTLTYTPSCIPGISPTNNSGYSSVAYLGNVNNPKNYFAVGDGTGTVTLMQIQFNSGNPNPINVASINSYIFNDPDTGQPCATITSMAVDPNGKWLYVGCSNVVDTSNQYTMGGIKWKSANYSSGIAIMRKALLGVAQINEDGTLGTINVVPPMLPSGAGTLSYVNSNNQYFTTKATGGVWAGASGAISTTTGNAEQIWPQLRAYSSDYPTFSNPSYSDSYMNSGAVLYSGFINGIMEPSKKNYQPVNSGLLCSDGSCQVAYNISLSNNNSFSVMTAAEYAADQDGKPVLWWNQVQGSTSGTPNGFWTGIAGGSSNSVVSYPLSTQLVNSAVNNNPTQTTSLNKNNWSNYMPNTIWVNQMLFLPTPASLSNDTSYTAGLLVMATRNNGYLAYYDVAAGQYEPEVFFKNNGENGEIGANPYGLESDANGNLLLVAGGSISASTQYGLLGLNPFPTQMSNIETQESVTYIPIPADANGGNDCGTACAVKQGYSIVSNVVSAISVIVASPPEANSSPVSSLSPAVQSSYLESGSTLEKTLGKHPFWGQFIYTESQMRKMGVRPGDAINGIQLRLAGGISPQPQRNIKFNTLQIGMYSDGPKSKGKTGSRYGSVVLKRSMCVPRESFNRNVRDGYGPVIAFSKPFRYLGGDLTLEMRHSGSKNSKRFYLDAAGGAGVSGTYAQLSSVSSWPTKITKLKVAPQVKFIKRNAGLGDSRAASECN